MIYIYKDYYDDKKQDSSNCLIIVLATSTLVAEKAIY
jgi:hypothetical protein